MDAIDAILDKVEYLPPLPRQVPQLLELLGKEEVDADEVVTLIAFDPTLTTNVMRLCNSVHFGSSRPVTDLQEAVLRLGFNEVYQLVLILSTVDTLTPAQESYGFETADLWKHSVITALAAKTMAKDRGDDDNMAFTAGLLHDVGKVVLAYALKDTYKKLLDEVQQSQMSMLEAEKKFLGVQHAEVGGRILARWKFSAHLVAGVWFHHEPILAQPYEKLAAYMYLANMVAYFMGFGYGYLPFAFRGRVDALQILGMDAAELPSYMLKTFETLESVKTLVDFNS